MGEGGLAQRHPRRLAVPVAAFAVLLALVSGWLAWSAHAEVAARSVTMTATGARDCAPGRDVNDGRRVLMVATPGLECRIDLVLTNRSGRDVRLHDVELFNVGTAEYTGNQMIYAVPSDGAGPLDLYGSDEMPSATPARYALDRVLAPDEVFETEIALVLNEDNCRGGTNELSPWPRVSVSVGGREHSVDPATSLFTVLAKSLPPDGPGCTD